ncbi:MAG: response regulator [Campylobacterales bacterium]|nr:response regulator [Campylobacterales bacterium]
MMFTNTFQQKFVSSLGMLTSCAHTHSDPFIYTYLSGELVGANSFFLTLLGIGAIEEGTFIKEWLHLQGVDLALLLSQSGDYKGKVVVKNQEYHVAVRAEILVVEDEFLVAIALRDRSIIERARAAERYFEQFKKKLLTNISHEFRTPMNAVIGFIDLLQSSPLTSWQKEYAAIANSSASAMMAKIENLLELMQVESGGIEAKSNTFNPLEVFESFSIQFDEMLRSKEIRLSVFIDPNFPLSIAGDQDKILTILRNLMQNAIKFTPLSGEVFLEISIAGAEKGEVEVEYAISDTGIGIENERLKTLLRPFSSAWDNQRRGQDGMGVGLSLSYKYITMMQSHLMLASEVGKGSRFSFRLKHPIVEEAIASHSDKSSIHSNQRAQLGKGKILVAEDNLINLRLLETILKQHHFEVVAVDNGQKAVDAYLKEPFDLVLMDIDMPVMDGLMANRLIKEIDKRDNRGFTPVIALTAHALLGDRERIIKAGLDAHLAKPIDKKFLLQTIEQYLKQSHEKRKSMDV